MKKSDELFEKIIYESNEFKNMQKSLDEDIEKLLSHIETTDDSSKEALRDEISGILFKSERETFGITLRYGLDLADECKSLSDNVDNL